MPYNWYKSTPCVKRLAVLSCLRCVWQAQASLHAAPPSPINRRISASLPLQSILTHRESESHPAWRAGKIVNPPSVSRKRSLWGFHATFACCKTVRAPGVYRVLMPCTALRRRRKPLKPLISRKKSSPVTNYRLRLISDWNRSPSNLEPRTSISHHPTPETLRLVLHNWNNQQSTMAAADASEKLALISENLTEILNPEIIEKILAEGRHPKIYWGTLARRWRWRYSLAYPYKRTKYSQRLSRHRYNWPPSLRLLCPRHQNRPVPGRRLPCHDPARRHPRLPRQPESPHRVGRAASWILPLCHHRHLQGRRRVHREAQVCPGQLVPEEPRIHHGRLQAVVGHLRARREEGRRRGGQANRQCAAVGPALPDSAGPGRAVPGRWCPVWRSWPA